MTDFSPLRDVQAISHINVVVDDIEVATEFYGTVLGFAPATNADGPMDYPGVDLASFARDAGFDDGRVSLDVRFLKQESYAKRGLQIEILGQDHVPEEIAPYPYTFFYWIDPWGVQWEMEQGRPIDLAVKGIVG